MRKRGFHDLLRVRPSSLLILYTHINCKDARDLDILVFVLFLGFLVFFGFMFLVLVFGLGFLGFLGFLSFWGVCFGVLTLIFWFRLVLFLFSLVFCDFCDFCDFDFDCCCILHSTPLKLCTT